MMYADLILPLALERTLTYVVPSEVENAVSVGMRCAVQVRRRIYTGLICRIHRDKPEGYTPEPIVEVLDTVPSVRPLQIRLWEWMASYYCCTLGEVFRAALPSSLKLESQMRVRLESDVSVDEASLSDEEFLIYEALETHQSLSVEEAGKILERKSPLPLLKRMIEKGVVSLYEQYGEKYKPRLEEFVFWGGEYSADPAGRMQELFSRLGKREKQKSVLLAFISLEKSSGGCVSRKKLLEYAGGISSGVLQTMVKNGIFRLEKLPVDRIAGTPSREGVRALSRVQQQALEQINEAFSADRPVLLHGVTGSGKTEIYVRLIEDQLQKGRQVLYLLPEIALTAQLVDRLRNYFGERVGVYHSRYNENERVEVWERTGREDASRYDVILAARSGVFLPFRNLGLVIVDEEHEGSFKQQDPAPRYQGRDTALVLARLWGADVLLGSATPSLESYDNARTGKYALVELSERYAEVPLPDVRLVDLKKSYRQRSMQGHFSPELVEGIVSALQKGDQVILFQNRRGFSPVVECHDCGHVPGCPHCDVSLTYHKKTNLLKCHYCGYTRPFEPVCPACGGRRIDTQGLGTEQIEAEAHELFPDARIARMDMDTTSGKSSHGELIRRFQQREIDILVGTQMLSKGLDFDNVSLVGVMNADNLLRHPDFRAFEKAYQMLSQVAGRAGRREKGQVVIQTFDPLHPILRFVRSNDYLGMYEQVLEERRVFCYPPFSRMIRLEFKHKDPMVLEQAVGRIGEVLRKIFGANLLGPDTPPVGRVNNWYLRQAYLKIPRGVSLSRTKERLLKVLADFMQVKDFRSVRFTVDVDCY